MECEDDDDCDDPPNKCSVGRCVDNHCQYVPKVCPPRTVCSQPYCDPWSGLCREVFDYACCSNTTLDHCFDPHLVCTEPFCDVLENETTGVCSLRNTSDCCRQECAAPPCYRAYCDALTGTCLAPVPLTCPSVDNDECTAPRCIIVDDDDHNDECIEERVAGMSKCPGACCFVNGSCAEMPETDCIDANGEWADSNVACGDIVCAVAATTHIPTTVPHISEYARTLCRVLNDCGDGDESVCMQWHPPPRCIELGCCSVTGVDE